MARGIQLKTHTVKRFANGCDEDAENKTGRKKVKKGM